MAAGQRTDHQPGPAPAARELTLGKPIGNRHAMEGELTPAQYEQLGLACVELGIPREQWHRSGIADYWCNLAARRAIRSRQDAGATFERALSVTAARFGIPAETLRTRLKRCRQIEREDLAA